MPVRAKICGIRNESDLGMAIEAGADAVGFNFHPASPRYLEPTAAAPLVAQVPAFVEAVAVFGPTPLPQAFPLAQQAGLTTVQWIGEHRELSCPYPFRFIAAFRVRDASSLTAITRYLQMAETFGKRPAAVLVDAHVEGQYGGTSQTAPWPLLRDFRPSVPLILAGGLTPDNVAEAIRIVRPFAVDVASGVESHPGVKDAAKVRRFLEAVRDA